MGSITSTPKLPKVQQPLVINMPSVAAPAASAAPAATNNNTTNDTTTGNSSSGSGSVTPSREENLLSRGRGVLGTVMTSLRGVLADTSSKTSSRKTLLGE